MEQLIDFHAPEVQAVLDTLLKDKSTGKNIIWATDPPEELQTVMYESVTDRSQITTQQLGLTHYEVVLPRMMKQTEVNCRSLIQCVQTEHIDSVRVTADLDLTFCQATVKSGKCCFSVLTK